MRKTNNKRMAVFRQRIPIYRKDITLFARELLHFEPDEWQRDVFADIVKHPRVSVKSGQGVGKTGCESIVAMWFLSCFPYAKVIATAPTARQLNDVLWAEIDKWRSKSPVLSEILKWTKTYIYVVGYEKRWFATARTATRPENMQGFHEDNMLFIVDEASGVPEAIMEAILGTLSGVNNKLLMCGNPTKTSGTFYDSFTSDRANYRCHTVNSELSPRTNKDNIAALIRKYGRESNVVRVRIIGEFPLQEDDVLIPLSLIEQAVITELEPGVSRISMGVDVARFGDDETVIASNVGGAISIPIVRHGQNLMRTVGDIVTQYHSLVEKYPEYAGPITAVIDDTGLGGGVTDRLNEVKVEQKLWRLDVVPVNFSAKPPKSEEHCQDIATYMWLSIRSLMENRLISMENDNELVAQLSVRKYNIVSNGAIQLESKKEMKKRGIKSPDRADAVALSCFTRNRIYSGFTEKAQAIIVTAAVAKSYRYSRICIGISICGAGRGTALVATGIEAGYKRAVALSSIRIAGDVETSALGKAFADFAHRIADRYGKVDFVYCDADEDFLFKSIRRAASMFGVQASVRSAANDDENNRIRLTTRLIAQGRLSMTEECDTLSQAMAAATWNENHAADSRSESSDIATLNAFEYTIEREASRFLANEGG